MSTYFWAMLSISKLKQNQYGLLCWNARIGLSCCFIYIRPCFHCL